MIRKLALFILPVLLCCMSSWGQNVQWVYNDKALEEGAEVTVTEYDPEMGQMLLELGIRNNTDKQLKVSVSKDNLELAEGGAVQLCVGTTCYPESVVKSDEFTLEPNETNTSFHANYLILDESKYGNSTVIFKLLSGDESISVKVHFNYSGTVANEKIDLDADWKIYASAGRIYVKAPEAEDMDLRIVNMNGISVYEQPLSSNADICSPVLANGIYVVALYQGGKVITSRKVSVR